MIRGIIRSKCQEILWAGLTGVRGMSMSVDKASLSKLRKKTGFSFINCKKALQQFNNDLEQAEKWLREQAQKEGWTKASKLQDRPMSSGLVGIIANTNRATMVEVNCETDFVARNEKFQALVSQLATACDNHFAGGTKGMNRLSTSDLTAVQTPDGKTLGDLVALEVGSIGENMLLRRAANIMSSNNSIVATYIHAAGPDLKIDNCVMGKFGALVEVEQVHSEVEEPLSLAESARQLCQHIVGMNPKTMGNPDEKPVENKDNEPVENKDNEPVENKDEEPVENKDDETRLIFQEFLLDPDLTVQSFMKNNGVAVRDFCRFECGEDLSEAKNE